MFEDDAEYLIERKWIINQLDVLKLVVKENSPYSKGSMGDGNPVVLLLNHEIRGTLKKGTLPYMSEMKVNILKNNDRIDLIIDQVLSIIIYSDGFEQERRVVKRSHTSNNFARDVFILLFPWILPSI